MRLQSRNDHRRWSAQLHRDQGTSPAEQQDPLIGLRPYADQIGGLVISCGKGEVAELGRLYDETIGWVYPMMRRASHDDAAAVTLTMAAYRQIWIGSPAFDSMSGCAVTWVMRQVRQQFGAIPNADVGV